MFFLEYWNLLSGEQAGQGAGAGRGWLVGAGAAQRRAHAASGPADRGPARCTAGGALGALFVGLVASNAWEKGVPKLGSLGPSLVFSPESEPTRCLPALACAAPPACVRCPAAALSSLLPAC